MFRSATAKLTLSYLAIIMVISLFFSVIIFNVSNTEIRKNFEPKGPLITRILPSYQDDDYGTKEALQEVAEASRLRLLSSLFTLNLAVLFLGGVTSYGLARYTLKPIEEAHEAQSRFTADASHELRTPLTVMRAEIEVALNNKKLSKKETEELLKSNLEELDNLSSLSNSLLRLARLEGNGLEMEKVKLTEVVDEAIKRHLPSAEDKSILIKRKIENKAVATGDKQSLVEVVSVLLDNAIKYSEPKKQITISLKNKNKTAVISVTDNGIGIKQSQLEHIFERFFRADSSSANVGGHGLGLSIAQSILEHHNGHIQVQSKPGKGSTFSVFLPLS